jgi:hypothetical protein
MVVGARLGEADAGAHPGATSMRRFSKDLCAGGLIAALVAGVASLAPLTARADPAAKPAERSSCFYINQIQNSRPFDDRTVLFRVSVRDIYRLDFAQSCPALTYPQPRLTLIPFGGVGLICHALDLDVRVGDQGPGAISMPCITKSLRKLTPDEVAAIPKKKLP